MDLLTTPIKSLAVYRQCSPEAKAECDAAIADMRERMAYENFVFSLWTAQSWQEIDPERWEFVVKHQIVGDAKKWCERYNDANGTSDAMLALSVESPGSYQSTCRFEVVGRGVFEYMQDKLRIEEHERDLATASKRVRELEENLNHMQTKLPKLQQELDDERKKVDKLISQT